MRRLSLLALLCAAIAAPPAAAQDAPAPPVVLLHGFASSGDAWRDTAARLEADLGVETHTPTTDWRSAFESQAADVDSQMASLASSPIAIGHSNGGIVARQWSRSRALRGLVTLGTPNWGAPIVTNLLAWMGFNQTLYFLVSLLDEAALWSREDWSDWITYQGAVSVALAIADPSASAITQAIGLRAALPVFPQMATNSSFLDRDLNSESNRTADAQRTPDRLAILAYDERYYFGGPFWVVDPENAPRIAALINRSSRALMFAASSIRLQADVDDSTAHDVADALFEVALWLDTIDPLWCHAISSASMNRCFASDGLVPDWSQAMPGTGSSHWIDWQGGPPHTRQIASSAEILAHALTEYMHVGRSDAPRPSNEPSPPPPPSTSDRLYPGQRLTRLVSADGRFELVYQGDGNLVLYAPGGVALWSTGTQGPGEAYFQGDGNLVIYDPRGQPLWWSATEDLGDLLVLQNDGNLVIYGRDGHALWSTGTFEPGGGAPRGNGGGSGGDAGGGGGGSGGGGSGGDACASTATHAHEGRCGEADACGHVFGSDADCGCPNAPFIFDACFHTVCNETTTVWIDDWCEGVDTVCDWMPYCWQNTDGGQVWDECGSYPYNCREEPYRVACGGHWEHRQGACRDEAYNCNERRCGW